MKDIKEIVKYGNLHGLEPEQLARIGMFYLEEAVLETLHEARHSEDEEEQWLQPADISKRLGIRAAEYIRAPDYPAIMAALDKLLGTWCVEQKHPNESGAPYRLTEKEFERRCDDL